MGEREQIKKNRSRLEKLRKTGGVKSKELICIAKKLGYFPKNRGKEPTWEHECEELLPLTIPGHAGDLAKGTKNRIIDRLLDDTEVLEKRLEGQDDE